MAANNFAAVGTVESFETKATQSGKEFATLVVKLGEYRDNPQLVAVDFWDTESIRKASLLHNGDEVAVGGRTTSRLSANGQFWNTSVYGNVIVPTKAPQAAQEPLQAPKADVYDEDIPF